MAERNLDFDTVIDRRNTKSLKYDLQNREKCQMTYFLFGWLTWTFRLPLMFRMR